MTISFFKRIFHPSETASPQRPRISVRDWSSQPPNIGPCRNSSTSASDALGRLPASVPLIPSCASGTLPISFGRGADRPQRLAQRPKIRQRDELIEGSDFESHAGGLSGRSGDGETPRVYPGVRPADETDKCHAPPAIAQRGLIICQVIIVQITTMKVSNLA